MLTYVYVLRRMVLVIILLVVLVILILITIIVTVILVVIVELRIYKCRCVTIIWKFLVWGG